jgi:ketosteroid isomerase-like protein
LDEKHRSSAKSEQGSGILFAVDSGSEENLARVRRFLEQARERPEPVWDIFHEDVVWDLSGIPTAPDAPSTSHGPDAVRAFFRRWAGAFRDWDYTVEKLTAGPGTVVAQIHQRGTGKGSGAPVEARFWQIWVMQRGQAIRVTHRLDEVEAFKDAGLVL